jgi:peptide/nickel transport system substrate-binding protein
MHLLHTFKTASLALSLFALVLGTSPLSAQGNKQELVIGLSATVSSMDPHFHNLTPNNSIARHIFDPLVRTDEKQAHMPGLAESWKVVDPLTWEFKLRKGVKWHDGSDFTADDVVATFKRVPNVPNSPASLASLVRPITNIQVVDKYTLRFSTAKPHPLMVNDMSGVPIISKKAAEAAKTEDFNSGKLAIGTGPFKFVEFVSGDRIVLARNDAYWGAKPAWSSVKFKIITNASARVAALLAGDVQLIENVPTADIAKLRNDTRLDLARTVSNRLVYLHLDTGREKNSPFVTDKAGKPMEPNPLRDVRVRRAISKAIDRQAITSRLMEGESQPAGQFLPEFFFGTSKKLPPEAFDPEGAKKLLTEAGYPNGFGITIHGPNNRYVNDEKIVQAVAQYLTRVGIQTKVETMPSTVFFTRGTKLEFSLLLAGWSPDTGEVSSPLRALVSTRDAALGTGAANRGNFSDAGLDAMISTAIATVDETKRGMLLAAASEKAIAGLQAIVPVHYEISTWGMRKGMQYKARVDQYTFAFDVKPNAK